MDERTKTAFDFAQKSVVQLITLASATIALEVSLLKDLATDHLGWMRVFALASWIAFGFSILVGVAAVLELTGDLDRKKPGGSIEDKDLTIYASAIRCYVGFQVLLFFAGLVATIALGYTVIGHGDATKRLAPSPTDTPSPCPSPIAQSVGRIVLGTVHFDSDRDAIRPDDWVLLREVVEVLEKHPALTIHLDGYCDANGRDRHNLELSLRRANSVARYLQHQGIAASRLVPRGFGGNVSVAPNDTDQGRERNRRVELIQIE